MIRFHLSCECKMQMTPSGDFFMTAVDSQRCSQYRNPVTPIRRPDLLSDSLHIGSIIQRAHQSYREMASAVIEGETLKLCMCVCGCACMCEIDTETAFGCTHFSNLLFFHAVSTFFPSDQLRLSSTFTLSLLSIVLMHLFSSPLPLHLSHSSNESFSFF